LHYAKPKLGSEKITLGETMVVQLVLSGILIMAVFLICLVDIGPLTSLRGGLRQVLAGATTVEAFTAEVRHFSQEWRSPETEPINTLDLPVFFIPELSLIYPYDNPFAEYEEFFDLQLPSSAYNEHSNPQIPGPLMSPGLWD